MSSNNTTTSFMRAYSIIATIVLGLVTSSVQAQTPPLYKVETDARAYDFNFTAAQAGLREMSVYVLSRGNVSSAIGMDIYAPPGTKITAEGGLIRGRNRANAVARGKDFYKYRLRVAGNPKPLRNLTTQLVNQGDTQGFASGWFHLHKDNCAASSSLYAAKITFRLPSLPQSAYEAGFKIQFAVKEYNHERSRASTIKPASDGKYRNEPILLMSTVAYTNEYVNIVRWSKGKISSMQQIPVVKYVSYRGLGLSLARLRGTLNGGLATYELTNGGFLYGVCFAAERRRQYANGYPFVE